MATEVKVPPMGESVTGGILAAWRVKDGDHVERDQVLFELETDKITTEGMAETAGQISLKAEEGEEVSIGQVVAEIDESATPAQKEEPAREEEPPGKPESAGPKEAKEPSPKKKKDTAPTDAETGQASPAVRRIAAETGIDPSSVQGSGKAGRVTKADILAAAEAADRESPPPAEPAPTGEPPKPSPSQSEPAGEKPVTRTRISPLRQRIAQRLVASQRDTATLSTFNEADLSAVRNLRAQYQEKFVKKHGIKLGFMSFFLKAVLHGLTEVPQLNSRLDGESLVQNHFYDIGVAVSTEKGLLVPVVRDCDKLGMADLENEIAGYAKKAREGKITIEDLEGGVFTITNGGIFGSLLSTPVINPPQSGILGMHTIQERPVAVDGEIVIRPMMYLALSYDHRIVDGREAVTFLVRVKEAIEDPARLLLDV